MQVRDSDLVLGRHKGCFRKLKGSIPKADIPAQLNPRINQEFAQTSFFPDIFRIICKYHKRLGRVIVKEKNGHKTVMPLLGRTFTGQLRQGKGKERNSGSGNWGGE